MRISPLAIFAAGVGATEAAEWARTESRLTHPHPVCQSCCAAFVTAIATAIDTGCGPRECYEAALANARRSFAPASVVQALTDAGQLTPDQARSDPHRSLLTRALGIAPVIEPDIRLPVVPGTARLLLCTDGLTAHAEDPQIADVLANAAEPDQAADQLVQLANRNGGSDNTAVIVIDVNAGHNAP